MELLRMVLLACVSSWMIGNSVPEQTDKEKIQEIVDQKLRKRKQDSQGTASLSDKCATAEALYQVTLSKGIKPSLLCALIEVESNWTLRALSPSGCVGLFQISPRSARAVLDFTPKCLYDPVINILCGVRILSRNQTQLVEDGKVEPNDWSKAIHTYFWGSLKSKNYSYLKKVLNLEKQYSTLFE